MQTNTMIRTAFACLLSACALLATAPAQSQVIVHGTRQIFPGDQREITVRVENVGQRASLIQAWTDDGDKQVSPEEASTPFVLRPPVFRLDPGKSQAMRVMFTGADLPQDRESIYWLNVLDIPPTPEADESSTGNFLQFSLRTRIKLIYRPKGLKDVAQAARALTWSLQHDAQGWFLQATNPTPYYVHMSTLALRVQGKDFPSAEPPMIAPLSSQRYPISGLTAAPAGGNVQFSSINDAGGVTAQSVSLPMR